MQLYNLALTVPDYYGKGNAATFYLLGFGRYSGHSELTVNLESAALFAYFDAEKALGIIRDAGDTAHWAIIPYVETDPPRKHNLRSVFV